MSFRQKNEQSEWPDKTASEKLNAQDNRVSATARIWSIAAGMLISGLAGSLGHLENVVWAAVIGAAVGTAALWGLFNQRSSHQLPPAKTLEEMDERLANVETIVSFEERISTEQRRRLETATEGRINA